MTTDAINKSASAFMVREHTMGDTPASAIAIDPLSHVGDGIFLQSKTCQGLAGIAVWVALFITCQQIYHHLRWYTNPAEQVFKFIIKIIMINYLKKNKFLAVDCPDPFHCADLRNILVD